MGFLLAFRAFFEIIWDSFGILWDPLVSRSFLNGFFGILLRFFCIFGIFGVFFLRIFWDFLGSLVFRIHFEWIFRDLTKVLWDLWDLWLYLGYSLIFFEESFGIVWDPFTTGLFLKGFFWDPAEALCHFQDSLVFLPGLFIPTLPLAAEMLLRFFGETLKVLQV